MGYAARPWRATRCCTCAVSGARAEHQRRVGLVEHPGLHLDGLPAALPGGRPHRRRASRAGRLRHGPQGERGSQPTGTAWEALITGRLLEPLGPTGTALRAEATGPDATGHGKDGRTPAPATRSRPPPTPCSPRSDGRTLPGNGPAPAAARGRRRRRGPYRSRGHRRCHRAGVPAGVHASWAWWVCRHW
ncbi:hypothetical protein SGRIM128S_01387 [Streptomyces griseomycini]